MTYDISNFIQWFITQFINIGTQLLNILDNIKIYANVTLLDFIITIVIIGAFISIIITAPNLGVVKRDIAVRDRQARRKEKNDNRK